MAIHQMKPHSLIRPKAPVILVLLSSAREAIPYMAMGIFLSNFIGSSDEREVMAAEVFDEVPVIGEAVFTYFSAKCICTTVQVW